MPHMSSLQRTDKELDQLTEHATNDCTQKYQLRLKILEQQTATKRKTTFGADCYQE